MWKGNHLCWSWGEGGINNRHREDWQRIALWVYHDASWVILCPVPVSFRYMVFKSFELFMKMVKVHCWSSPWWSSIPPRINKGDRLSTCKLKLTVDPLCVDRQPPPPPRINRGNHLSTHKWKLTVDPLCVDRQSPQNQQRRSPFHARVKVDSWSSPC